MLFPLYFKILYLPMKGNSLVRLFSTLMVPMMASTRRTTSTSPRKPFGRVPEAPVPALWPASVSHCFLFSSCSDFMVITLFSLFTGMRTKKACKPLINWFTRFVWGMAIKAEAFLFSFSSKLLPHLHRVSNLLIIKMKHLILAPTPVAVILQPFFS